MTKKKNIADSILLFKVILLTEFEEDEIWRIIALRPHHTLKDFHKIIFRAFDRNDERMWSFFFGEPGAKQTKEFVAEPWIDLERNEEQPELGERIKLKDLRLRRNSRIYYLFDYGDEWWHEIKFLGVEKAEPGKRYPKIIEKHGESLPQYFDEDYFEDDDYDDENGIEDFSFRTVDLERQVSFSDLEKALSGFKNALDASEVVGYLRGIIAAQKVVLPSRYFSLFTGVDDSFVFDSFEQLQEISSIFGSLNNKFVNELITQSFSRFRRANYENSFDGLLKRVKDMIAEVQGFIRGLDIGHSSPDDLDEIGMNMFEKLAELNGLLEAIVRSEDKLRKDKDKNGLTGFLQLVDRLDAILFELIADLSISFSKKRLIAGGIFKGDNRERMSFDADNSPASPNPKPIKSNKIYRNAPCPCGSGLKYKKCCGK